MLRMSVKIDVKKLALLDNVRLLACRRVAGIFLEEFRTMLYEAPQYSGNYVGNMMLSSGVRAGKGDADPDAFPIPKDVSEAVSRGDLPAINTALNNVGTNFIETSTAHIRKSAGWLTGLTVYNKLKYAEVVEDYDTLRTENAGGEHAVSNMFDRLASRHETFKW